MQCLSWQLLEHDEEHLLRLLQAITLWVAYRQAACRA